MNIDQTLLQKGWETPVINHQPLPEYAMENLDYGMTIGLAVTKGGTIYVAWVGGGDSEAAYMLLARSTDGGETYSQPLLVIDPHSDELPIPRCCIVGTLFCDEQNRLWMFFDEKLHHYDGRNSNWYIRCDNPDDEHPVWSEPQYFSYGCTLNKPTVLRDGSWLLPVSLWQRHHIRDPFKDCYHELDNERKAHVFKTCDQGETWQQLGGVFFPDSRFDEHMTLEKQDGTLWMLGRVKTGLMEAYSSDGGLTWTEPVRAHVQSVEARFHLRRLPSGRVLLIKHGQDPAVAAQRRELLTAFLSEDDGATFPYALLLDERFEVSYPDADLDPEGYIRITYDRNRAADGEIVMARIKEEDILAGKLVSEGSYLQRVILYPHKAPNRLKEQA